MKIWVSEFSSSSFFSPRAIGVLVQSQWNLVNVRCEFVGARSEVHLHPPYFFSFFLNFLTIIHFLNFRTSVLHQLWYRRRTRFVSIRHLYHRRFRAANTFITISTSPLISHRQHLHHCFNIVVGIVIVSHSILTNPHGGPFPLLLNPAKYKPSTHNHPSKWNLNQSPRNPIPILKSTVSNADTVSKP